MTGGGNRPRLLEKQVTLGTMSGQRCLEENYQFSMDNSQKQKDKRKEQKAKT
jgi:hypothetical protein